MSVKGYRYARYGPIAQVLKLDSVPLDIAGGSITVAVKKAPIHRTDAAVINGTAGVKGITKAAFPRVGGSEAFGAVADANGSKFKSGDLVWVAPPHGGWAEKVVAPVEYVYAVNSKHAALAPHISSLLVANRLLKAHKLSNGSAVIQNGGSSITSLAVSALGKSKGFKVVTAATPGDRFSGASSRHKAFGSEVVEYNAVGARKAKDLVGPKGASLYLNGVGGRPFNNFLKVLGNRGTVVTYGAQNGFGLLWGGSQQIFNDLTMIGFSLPKYIKTTDHGAVQAELDEVLETFSSLNFKYPTKDTKLDGLPQAWDEQFLSGGHKAVLTL